MLTHAWDLVAAIGQPGVRAWIAPVAVQAGWVLLR
ncbi:hypothetical protein MGAST_04925 [Mycobacterium gastri 'Wayne']|nr:hypothetical protein MGAST_04925 [Mycobacterium gastri 'Wayne']